MKSLISTKSLNTDLATLLLRLIFGGMFVYYGYGKVANYEAIAAMFTDIIGIGARLSFNLVIFAELICGFFILMGLLTRFAVIPVFITMFVAYFIAHANDAFDVKTPAFIYMLFCFVIFVLGSGKYSIDALLFDKSKKNYG